MRICLMIGSLDVGGAETQLCLLAKTLKANGHAVTMIVLNGQGPFRQTLRDAEVDVVELGSMRFARSKVSVLWHAYSTLRRLRPDVLLAYLPLTAFIGAVAGRMAGIRCVVIGKRALGNHQSRTLGWAKYDRIANRLAHKITANSQAVKDDTITRDGVDDDKIAVIPNAIDLARLDESHRSREELRQSFGLTDADVLLLTVGNVIPYKGHSDLLDALELLDPAQRERVHLILAGRPGDLGEELVGRAREKSVNFRLLGPRSDVSDLLRASDLFVLPSHEEGMPNALIEALATGVPAIATDVGGIPEVLEHGALGALVPARNAGYLSAAILDAVADLDARKAAALSSVPMVRKKYALENVYRSHMDLFGTFVHPR